MTLNSNIVTADDKLSQIHSLMQSANRNVWLERHTLVIWGVTIGLVIAALSTLTKGFYQQNFWLGVLVEHVVLGLALSGAIVLDYKLTRRRRIEKDETFSLLQRRLTRIVWLLFLFAYLLSLFAVIKLGGGGRVLGVHLVLGGIVLLLIGQFSLMWYRWTGVAYVLLGSVVMFLFYPGITLRIVVATAFIVGSLYCAWVAPYATTAVRCTGLILLKLLLIAAIASGVQLAYDHFLVNPGRLPVVSYADFLKQPETGKKIGRKIVTLPAGTKVPVEIQVSVDLLTRPAVAKTELITRQPMQMVIDGTRLTGVFRVVGGTWVEARNAVYVRRFFRKTSLLHQSKPIILRRITISTQRRYGGLAGQ